MYLFDTDTITNTFRSKPSEALLTKLKETEPTDHYVSVITIYEIVYGAWKSDNTRLHLEQLQDLLLPIVRIADFDSPAAYLCGSLRAGLEKNGTPLSLADLQIASIALANDLILVTGNTRHFERVPDLRVKNRM